MKKLLGRFRPSLAILNEFVLDPSEGLTDLAQQVFFADGVLSYDDPIPESDLVDRSFLEEARG